MLGLQGTTSPTKVYRCVACSATFNGLASLLVHQATHASAFSKASASPPLQTNTSSNEKPFVSTNSSSAQPNPSLLPESPSPSFYICDCGEEFQDFGLMLEHKRSHTSQMQLLQPLDNNVPVRPSCDEIFPTQHASCTPVTQSGLVLSCPSTSKSPAAVEIPVLTAHKADVSLEDGIAIVTNPQGQCTPPQGDGEEDMSTAAEQMPETVENMHFQDKDNSISSSGERGNLPQKNTLMKLLASAYMKRFPLPQPQNHSENTVVPKQEVVPVDITTGAKSKVSQANDLSIAQLRRLLAKPGIKTKAPSISRILETSRKKVVSLTKTLSPVVVLETRQKLMDPSGKGAYGGYQCGRCRRVFQNLNRLTEHHFLHKKERIKCCRRCKQLIIGWMPLPDSHVCSPLANKSIQPSNPLKSKFPFAPKIMPFHSLNSKRKVFFCPLCKHSYARRWNLKNHKCHGPVSVLSRQAGPLVQKMLLHRSNSNAKTDIDGIDAASQTSQKSIAGNTQVIGHVKVEVTSPNSNASAVSHLAWAQPAKHFSPFSPKSSMMGDHQDPSLCDISLQQGEENNWGAESPGNEDANEGQWTMPLDDEMEMLHSAEKAGDDEEVKTSVSVEHAEMAPQGLRYFVRDGVRRYPCNRCQKTYSRASTLRRHLRLCGFRPRALGIVTPSVSQGATTPNASSMEKLFACFVCGKNFNRKDNMMAHRKKCQFRRTVSDAERATAQPSVPGAATTDCQTKDNDGSNWGIMSLPSVLPRRVTCECGVGFTSPRLLLEHLQKHAQESYTCPTCGETVNSWADYEVHLQIHMHPHHQLLKGLQPQRSQPLLLRFQQQQPPPPPPQQQQPPPQQQQPTPPSPSVRQPPQKQPNPESLLSLMKKQQRIVCTRCGNTFSTRCSLRRHLSWNRCKGGRVTNLITNPPKTYHCSHCNSDFPNAISLIFHQRSGACKPAIKPVRCPVCLRWFGTVDSLQKHLLTHKRSDSFCCDVCQGTYPNLKSLKNHRRRVHRIMAGDTQPKTQE